MARRIAAGFARASAAVDRMPEARAHAVVMSLAVAAGLLLAAVTTALAALVTLALGGA